MLKRPEEVQQQVPAEIEQSSRAVLDPTATPLWRLRENGGKKFWERELSLAELAEEDHSDSRFPADYFERSVMRKPCLPDGSVRGPYRVCLLSEKGKRSLHAVRSGALIISKPESSRPRPAGV